MAVLLSVLIRERERQGETGSESSEKGVRVKDREMKRKNNDNIRRMSIGTLHS